MALLPVTLAQLDIPTAGTAVQVNGGTSLNVTSVTFYAVDANTGQIYIGDSNVASNRLIVALDGGESLTISADQLGPRGEEFDLADFWVDTATNGNDVQISYVKVK